MRRAGLEVEKEPKRPAARHKVAPGIGWGACSHTICVSSFLVVVCSTLVPKYLLSISDIGSQTPQFASSSTKGRLRSQARNTDATSARLSAPSGFTRQTQISLDRRQSRCRRDHMYFAGGIRSSRERFTLSFCTYTRGDPVSRQAG